MASPELSPLPAAMASCTRPTVRPASQMARVVDSVEGVRNVHVVYSESYHAAVFDKPRSLRDASEFCAQIGGRDNRAFRFCDRNALAWQEDARRMRLLVVAQGCAFFDRGKRWKGGTYDGRPDGPGVREAVGLDILLAHLVQQLLGALCVAGFPAGL